MDEKHDPDEASISSSDGAEGGVCGSAQRKRSDDPADIDVVRSRDAAGRETKISDASVPCDHSSSGPDSPSRPDALTSASSLSEVRPDVTTMEQAICSGDPDEVSALLSRLDKVSAIKQLTGCYGGRPVRYSMSYDPVEDGRGLFRMTNPLLHAARTGITSMFSAVHGAMQEKLRARQVRIGSSSGLFARAMCSKPGGVPATHCTRYFDHAFETRPVTSAKPAGRIARESVQQTNGKYTSCSGCSNICTCFCRKCSAFCLERSRARLQLLQPVRCTWRRSEHRMARRSAVFFSHPNVTPGAYFVFIWNASLVQVKIAMRAEDEGSRSLLMMAVASKNKDMFGASLAVLEQNLTKYEVKKMMISMGPLPRYRMNHSNVLDWAARSGCKDLFEAALTAVKKWLTQIEVGALTTSSARGETNRSRILESAAASGDVDTWRAVLTALETTEVKDEVMSMEPDAKISVLKSAIRSGSVDMFVTVFADLNGHLLLEEPANDFEFWSILLKAIGSGRHDMLIAVQTALKTNLVAAKRDPLSQQYVEALHAAAKSGSTDILEAVLGMLDVPGEDKIKAMTMPCTSRKSTSALHAAAGSGSKEMFEVVLTALAGKLPPDEVSWIQPTPFTAW
ncbi:unnamed protein product [Scytosiphon promiscuus]